MTINNKTSTTESNKQTGLESFFPSLINIDKDLTKQN